MYLPVSLNSITGGPGTYPFSVAFPSSSVCGRWKTQTLPCESAVAPPTPPRSIRSGIVGNRESTSKIGTTAFELDFGSCAAARMSERVQPGTTRIAKETNTAPETSVFRIPEPPDGLDLIAVFLRYHLARKVVQMARAISRRTALLGFPVLAATLASKTVRAQSPPVRRVERDFKEDLFYRDDWLGEPWRTPEPVVLIHGNDESSVEWYAWVPRMAQEYRVIRPDLPGLGHSNIPPGFQYSLANLATFVTRVMDKAGVESAHIVGAKTGGSVAMRLAADYPQRTRTLIVVGGPASPLQIANPSPIPQRDRLGSEVSREMVEYWN